MQRVVFWPNTAATNAQPYFGIDSAKQLQALRERNPVEDARIASKSGDYRPVGDSFVLKRFRGIPDRDENATLFKLALQVGFKVTAVSGVLLTNQEFIALRDTYEEGYNRALCRQAAAKWPPNKTGSKPGQP